MKPADLTNRLSPKLIDKIQSKIVQIHQLPLKDGFLQSGIIIPDNQGIAMVAKDDNKDPFLALSSIPIPLLLEDALQMRNRWHKYKDKLDADSSDIEILFTEIDNLYGIESLSTLLGCFLVYHLHREGISLQEQVAHNKLCTSKKILEVHFFIVTLGKIVLRFKENITSLIRKEER